MAAKTLAPRMKRKNFNLDQRRLDLVKIALGAKTETEALTRAMDIAIRMANFAAEVHEGSARMFGKGGFVNYFDDESKLDWSGFDAARPKRSDKARRVRP